MLRKVQRVIADHLSEIDGVVKYNGIGEPRSARSIEEITDYLRTKVVGIKAHHVKQILTRYF